MTMVMVMITFGPLARMCNNAISPPRAGLLEFLQHFQTLFQKNPTFPQFAYFSRRNALLAPPPLLACTSRNFSMHRFNFSRAFQTFPMGFILQLQYQDDRTQLSQTLALYCYNTLALFLYYYSCENSIFYLFWRKFHLLSFLARIPSSIFFLTRIPSSILFF